MKYVKPELDIEKFSIVEDIAADGMSGAGIIIDEGGNVPGYEKTDPLIDAMSTAIGNIFNIGG